MLALLLAQVLLLTTAQEAAAVAPRSYRPEFENARVRVTRVVYRPREKIAVHDHPAGPTVYVYLRDSGPVRFVHLGEDPFTLTRPAVRAGGFRLSKGARETHSVESLTDRVTEYLRVELKDLDVDRRLFRGRFPPEPAAARRRTGQRVRYEDAQVRITRVTCAARSKCPTLGGDKGGSLLVALTHAHLKSAGDGTELTWELGQTVWYEPGTPALFANASNGPAEFLRIDLK